MEINLQVSGMEATSKESLDPQVCGYKPTPVMNAANR